MANYDYLIKRLYDEGFGVVAQVMEKLQKERDALYAALKTTKDCKSCKHSTRMQCGEDDYICPTCMYECKCKECVFESAWEWSGAEG